MATSKEFKDVPVETLLKRFKESADWKKKKYMKFWDKSKSYYHPEGQWSSRQQIAWFQSFPEYNKHFEFVEAMRGFLSDRDWGIDVVPTTIPKRITDALLPQESQLRDTQDVVGMTEAYAEVVDMADRINKMLDFLWIDQKMRAKLASNLLWVFLYGTGIIKSVFSGASINNNGIGQIETTVVSPRYIFPDPACSSVHDASFIIEHHPVTLRWVQERYPEKFAEVKEAGVGSTTEWNEGQAEDSAGVANSEEAQRVDILECYYLDSTIVEDEEGSDGTPKKAYPNGRRTIMTTSKVVLDDGPADDGFPYVRFVEIPRPGEFFGDATVWRGMSIQDSINTLLRAIIDNGLWMVHGITIADDTSGITKEKVAQLGPRSHVVKRAGTEFRRDVGEPLPHTIFQTLENQVDAYDIVVGHPNVLKGIVPSRQPVGTVEMQKEAGDVRTRERQRRVEEALEDLGQLWIRIVSNHWADKRIIHNKRMLGGFEMFNLSKADMQEWQWSVTCIPGSTSPVDSQIMLDKAIKLRTEVGVALPDQYLVDLARLPNARSALVEQNAEQPLDDDAGVNLDEQEPMPEQEMEIPQEPMPEDMPPPELMGGLT